MTNLLEKSNASDTVMRQALIYMGEWIDSASESMNKISTNSEEIIDIKSAIEGLKKSAPQQTEILNSIEEKFDEQQERLSYFEKQISKLSSIEEQFIEQQERIDRLEMSLEKILSAVEDIDDSKVTRKIDKIDKQIAKLSTNIEKLTSYVD
jgi:chromosome segregation ATPase